MLSYDPRLQYPATGKDREHDTYDEVLEKTALLELNLDAQREIKITFLQKMIKLSQEENTWSLSMQSHSIQEKIYGVNSIDDADHW